MAADSNINIIDDLFNVSTCVTLADRKVYLRVLSDIDLQERDVAAMAAARSMRKQLRDVTSPIHRQYVVGLEELSREETIKTLHSLHDPAIVAEVAHDIQPLYIPPTQVDVDPEDATKTVERDPTLEERLDVQEKRDEEWQATLRRRLEVAEQRIAEYDAELQAMDDNKLMATLKQLQFDTFVQSEYLREKNNMTIFLTCYSDEGCNKRYFRKIEDVRKMNPRAKAALLNAYGDLEDYDLLALKN